MDRDERAGNAGSLDDSDISAAASRAERRSARYRRVFQLLTTLLLLLATSAGLYFLFLNAQLGESVARMQTVREAMQENRKLLGLTIDLEAGLRGYLLTADERLLAAYEAADQAIPGQIATLERLLGDRESLIAEMAQIKDDLASKRAELASVQNSFDRGERREVRQSYRRDMGERRTNALRASVGAIESYLEQTAADERRIANRLMRHQFTAIVATLTIVGLIGIAAMVLGRRHFEALRRHSELSLALSRSQQHSEDKTVFLAQVSHEIRTPMNAIFGFSGLLQDRLEDAGNRRYIDAITSSAHALLSVVNDLLDYSSIEAGKLGLTRRPSDLRGIVDSVTSLLATQATEKQLSLSVAMDANLPLALLMDGDRVRQMLLNLISNAVKYTERGSVTVRVSAQPGTPPHTATCTIDVIDTGVGIAQDQQEYIFKPFARGGVPGAISGTGLGLSITRQLARAMGGDVQLASQPGAGSRFKLVLPDLPIVPAVAAEGARSGLRLRDLPPLRTLAVDDVALNREVISAMFARSPHELRLTDSASNALAMIEQWQPDVLLLDIRMMGMDGIELARHLRAQTSKRDLCLIAVTATKLDAHGENGALFDGILIKPFTEQALAAALAHALDLNAGSPVSPDAEANADAAGLLEHLRVLRPRWQALSDALTISDARIFAETVHDLGRRHGSAGIQLYGRNLLAAVATFDVVHLETLLATFPDHIAGLECHETGAGEEPHGRTKRREAGVPASQTKASMREEDR